MSVKTQPEPEIEVIEKAKGFWEKNSKSILYASVAIIVLIGGYLGYKYMVQIPNETKAQDEIFRAEMNFRKDSIALALNGTPTTPGFLKVISKYGGTKSGNLAKLYAGECYLQLGDFKNAAKYLEDFNGNGAKQVEARVAGMLGDAYSELKQNDKAVEQYKKSASLFPEDANMASEYLFRAGLLLEMNGKSKEAIEVYKQLKDKFPRTEKGFGVDKYLARLGDTN
ncbi:MAG: tetratricopeptide repeat protein [Chitinophagaceae bacterium]